MLVETTNTLAGAITGAIRKAAQFTGAGFEYLLATARIESGLNPTIKAPTSSASGLFQFIDQTWLATLKQSGSALGFDRYAQAISKTTSGKHVVADPALRAEIMDLRKDPSANAMMAGAFTRRNAARMSAKLGRNPTNGELYMAHFLGSAGATKLVAATQASPDQSAAKLFPAAAAANRGIFYNKHGSARSTAQVYQVLAGKLDRAQAITTAQIGQSPQGLKQATAKAVLPVVATAANRMPNVEVASLAPLPGTPPMAEWAPSRAPAAPTPSAPIAPVAVAKASSRPMFYDLFRDEGRGAVAAVVAELWGARSAAAGAPAATGAASRQGSSAPVDVFGLTQHQRARS